MSATTGGPPKAKSGCGAACAVILVVAVGLGLAGLIIGIVVWLKYSVSDAGTPFQKEHTSPEVIETPRATPTEKPSATASEPPKPASTPARRNGTVVNPSPGDSKLEITVNRETFLMVFLNPTHFPPAFFGSVSPSEPAVVITGKHFWVQAMDPSALELRKNGQPVKGPDPDIVIEKF